MVHRFFSQQPRNGVSHVKVLHYRRFFSGQYFNQLTFKIQIRCAVVVYFGTHGWISSVTSQEKCMALYF